MKLRSFSQPLSRARGRKRVVAGLKILTRRSQVFQLEVQVAPQEVSVGEIVPFLEFPLFGGDPRRAFGGRSAIHGIKNACGVADRPAESSVVLLAFEKFNGEQKHRDVVWIQSDHTLGVVRGADVVLQLETGFHQGTVNIGAVWVIRILIQEAFEVADERRAIVPGIADGLL